MLRCNAVASMPHGIEEAHKRSSWHDEPLKGKRSGQRSIRLKNQWRAIYEIKNDVIKFISVEEVTPHAY